MIRSSQHFREELSTHVHRPVFEYVEYQLPTYDYDAISTSGPAVNVIALREVVDGLKPEDDPYVKSLRVQLAKLGPGDQRNRVDQELSKALNKDDTFTHKGLRDFLRTACDICYDLGPWAANWFVATVISKAMSSSGIYNNIMASWKEREKQYLMMKLSQVHLAEVSMDPGVIYEGLSARVRVLVETLKREEEHARLLNEPYSGIIFVDRRDSVLVLRKILMKLSDTSTLFRVGCLLGSSNSFKRHSFLDITRGMLKETPTEVLQDFRAGDKNLIVSTAVAEEGIDIQACGSVIRFDPPKNMVSWAQSRGRARRKQSRFVIMFDTINGHSRIAEWEEMEKQMLALYISGAGKKTEIEESEDDSQGTTFTVEGTGYVPHASPY